MRYPTHIILDVQTRTTSTVQYTWQGEFLRTASLGETVNQNLSPINQLTFSTNSQSIDTGYFNSDFPPLKARSITTSIFDIHFLRKEKLYTKLKYSRCPQYDIVSGGFAALLAGFIGFLISEKFGIELVDSGDFYIAMMYGVFVAFSVRPLIRVYSEDNTPYSPLSLKYLLVFMRDITILVMRSLLKIIWAVKNIVIELSLHSANIIYKNSLYRELKIKTYALVAWLLK